MGGDEHILVRGGNRLEPNNAADWLELHSATLPDSAIL
jgi:hypothetical protein